MLDDITLIRKYLRQESTLLSNPQLRVQTAQETAVQLLTRRGELLATADFTQSPPQVAIRPGSRYETLLHQMLVAHHFLPQGACEGRGFACYSYHQVPEGYDLHVTSALELWKWWWSRYRFKTPQERGGSQTDLMLFTRNQWYPVRDVISDRGTLFLKTWVSETAHTGEDTVVWLSRQAGGPSLGVTQLVVDDSGEETPPPRPPSPEVALAKIVRHQGNKLYVRTPLGYLAVEGENLRYALVPPRP